MTASKCIFPAIWLLLAGFLAFISIQYRSKTDAMMAVVESQVTAISYQKPVVIERIYVAPGQEVRKGDTLIKVSRPDLSLDLDKKLNEIERLKSRIIQTEQNYRSKASLIRLETEGKLNRLGMEQAEHETRLDQQKSVSGRLKGLSGNNNGRSYSDSLLSMKVYSLQQEINDVESYAKSELERQRMQMVDEKELLLRELEIINRELKALQDEYGDMVKLANFDGIVGTVGAQLDELIPPYRTVISIFEKKPTTIKAYLNETIPYPVKPGDSVKVVSENRLYSIKGFVLELGARITDFPEKIQPITSSTKSYGQEIFIKIPPENQFLNGEKVFVYPIDL